MKLQEKISVIEAILFASGDPIEADKLADASGVTQSEVTKLVKLLSDRYDESHSALSVLKLGTAYQLAVRREYDDYIKAALEQRRAVPLSQAAMEVLTIIAYNQPVTKGFVEHVRGIDSSSVVNSLLEKNLLEEAGRLDVPGRPIAYKTTDAFLRAFQLSSLEELPALPSADGQVSFDEILINETELSDEADTEPDE
ncbi:MAG: SMC-Scp complex subunit ScpB [Ruminococcus sp.]|nr:SMC-Scp complex subunit ScpB [Ruminococcus sp.]